MSNPKVSVIIPVYNAEKYLIECLNSVINQTEKNIEIICINDASNDTSINILSEFAKNDHRIKIIDYNVNKSASQARKDGVLISQGKYIMFLDADDTLETSACQSLSNMMDKYDVDILQFGTYVDALPSVKESTRKFFEGFAKPYNKFLYGKEIFEGCFEYKKYRFTLWNKIYKSDLCKKAFFYIKDGCFSKAQDLYAFFIIAYFAKSYYGINKKFYHYNYGRGITGIAHKTKLKEFERICSQKLVSDECKNFLINQGSFEFYNNIWKSIYKDLLNECINHFVNNIENGVEEKAFDILNKIWGTEAVIDILKTNYLEKMPYISMKISKEFNNIILKEYIKIKGSLTDIKDAVVPLGFDKIVPIVFATNNKYAPYAVVAIQSILENANKDNFYRIYVLHTDVSSYNIEILENICSNQATIKCINVTNLIQSKNVTLYEKAHFTKEAFYRFWIPEIFPFYEKTIYLDCDLILNTDISEIIPNDNLMNSMLVAAVHNALSKLGSKRIWENFGLISDEYFNSGVLVINNKQWILEDISRQCFEKLRTIPEKKLVCIDQDILNIVCRKRIYYLSPEWNYYWHLVYGNEELQKLYQSTIDKVGNNFKIIHYASAIKPWENPQLPLARYFWKYARKTDIYEEIVKRNFTNKETEENNVNLNSDNFNKLQNNYNISLKNINDLTNKIYCLKQDLERLQNSCLYRFSNKIEKIIHKLEGGLRCYKEHGLIYTFKRILFHLNININKKKNIDKLFDLWILKKLKGGVRCYKEHGLIYTLERMLVHLKILKNNTSNNNKTDDNKNINNEQDKLLGLGCSQKLHSPQLIVSLTSFPDRINTVHKTIETILEQSERPDKVVLCLAKEQFPNKEKDLPDNLLVLQQYGLQLIWYHDIKSYKKLIPVLTMYPEAIIVTADDDVYYDHDWLKLLYQSYKKYPSYIHCHRDTKFYIEGDEFKAIPGGKEKYSCPTYLHKLVGIGGVLYPPHSLYSDVIKEELFFQLAPTNDDIWFWIMAVKNDTKILVVENNLPQPKYVEGTQEGKCLTKINDSGENLFWVDFNRVLSYYPEVEKKFYKEFEFISQYEDIIKIKNKNYDYYNSLDKRQYAAALCEWYHRITGDWLNIDKPITFNEKIQWLKLYDSTDLKTKLADKFLVREYVADKIGGEYLVPILGVWDSLEEIDFNKLPNKFVLKANHGSGWNIIVKNKSLFNREEAAKKFNLWLKKNYAFQYGFELHYMNIKPKIIAEKYIEEIDQVYDYKFMCFNGKVKFIWVDTGRFSDHRRTFFNLNWEKINVKQKVNIAAHNIEKPKNLDKMIYFSELLSERFALARVDFYEVRGKLYFGEITFTSASGTEKPEPSEYDYEWGGLLKLPKKNQIPEKLVNI